MYAEECNVVNLWLYYMCANATDVPSQVKPFAQTYFDIMVKYI